MSIEFEDNELSTRIIAAAAALKPYQPEIITASSLVPYFKELGMTDEGIVPYGLREYTTQILNILGLAPTIPNLQVMLQRPEVKETLRSAIAVATKAYKERQEKEAELMNNAPDMSNINGITQEQMNFLMQKAAKEKEIQEQADSSERNYATDVFVNPFSKPAPEEPEQEEPPKQKELPKTATPLEDKPEPLPEPEPREDAETDEHKHNNPVFCPRCGWIVSVPYSPEVVSEEDRIQFAYSIMHRTPFKKTYGLFQNQIRITFRSKTVEDNEIMLEQLRKDSVHQKFADLAHMNHYAVKYEMALLLDKIELPSDSKQYSLKPQFKDFVNEEEPLVKYTDAIYNEYIVSDILKQLIETHYRSFNRLYSALIDEAMSENFYNPA